MSSSELQEPYLKENIETIRSAQLRISKGLGGEYPKFDDKIAEAYEHLSESLTLKQKEMIKRVVWDELRGTLHGFLVTLDGGSALADDGLIYIEDESGLRFDSHLHELAFSYLTESELE